MSPRLAVSLAALPILLISAVGCDMPSAAIGRKLPPVQPTPLAGPRMLNPAALEGEIVMLHVWGTWCPPCRAEMPELVEMLKRRSRDSGFVPMLVALNSPPSDARRFLDEVGWQGPAYVDSKGEVGMVLSRDVGLGSFGVPTTLIADRSGVIRGHWQGYHPRGVDQMDALIGKLLSEK